MYYVISKTWPTKSFQMQMQINKVHLIQFIFLIILYKGYIFVMPKWWKSILKGATK